MCTRVFLVHKDKNMEPDHARELLVADKKRCFCLGDFAYACDCVFDPFCFIVGKVQDKVEGVGRKWKKKGVKRGEKRGRE